MFFHRYGACADNVDYVSNECQDLLICVNEGTTFADIAADLFPESFIVVKQDGDLVVEGLASGDCNAIAGGIIDVSLSNVRDSGGYDGDYETGSNRFSKDPLALVTRQDDPQWSDFAYWTVGAIFYAEENGITAESSNKMPIVNLFGRKYARFMRDIIAAVGNYGEIYERNVEAEVPRGGLVLVNSNPTGPQHYPLPGLPMSA